MFREKKEEQENKEQLFQDVCLLLLKTSYNPKHVGWEDMLELCEQAESIEMIIKNWKTWKEQGVIYEESTSSD